MPEGVGYGPQNTASTGLTLNVIGNHAYGHSGLVTSTSSQALLLDFETGPEYINSIILFNLASGPTTGVIYWFDVTMNGVIVNRQILNDPNVSKLPSDSDNLHIILPPYTKVQCIGYAASGDKDFCVILKGRIYK